MAAAHCLTCAHYRLKEAGKMAALACGLCALGSRWTYFSPTHTCPRHQPVAAVAVIARTAYLVKKVPNYQPPEV